MRMSANAIVFFGVFYPGGVVRHLVLLAVEMFKSKLRDFDLYLAGTEKEFDQGSWAYAKNAFSGQFILQDSDFSGLVESIQHLFDRYNKILVHCGGGWGQTKQLIPLRKKYGSRLILVGTTHSYRHDSWLRIPMSVFQVLLYLRYYDMIVFQCQYAVDRFWGGRLLFWRKKATIIPLGCESFDDVSDNVPPGIANIDLLHNVLIDMGLFKFVYLAAFRPGKMHVWLVRAIASALKRFPNARVLFCGSGDDRVVRSIKDAIRKAGVEGQILLPGRVSRDEVPWLLAHCNCAVVPSRAETFGHNFLEPMFAGLPVLGTSVGVGRDIIIDGQTGFVFSLACPRRFGECAKKMLLSPDRVGVMGENARLMVEKDYSHKAVASRHVALYQRLLKGVAGGA